MGPSLEHCMSPVAAVGARTIARSKKKREGNRNGGDVRLVMIFF
jgi:hypothetical protein